MIIESKISHKVPAISTSEDSHEASASSSDCRSPTDDETREEAPPMDDQRCDENEASQHRPQVDKDRDDPNEVSVLEDKSEDASMQEPKEGKEMELDESSSKHNNATDAPLAMLPSMSTSFDHGVPVPEGHPWSHHSARDAASSLAKERASKPRHRRSPATTFPLPSPRTHEYGDDEGSFNLFNQSFDTMSDTATYLRELHPNENRDNDGISPSFSMLGIRSHQEGSNVDISLPALGYGATNVSPIRAAYGPSSTSTIEPIMVHFPQETEEDRIHQVQQAGGGYSYQTNAYGGASMTSNPYFVLRCARKAFSRCTFLLSCLRDTDPCAVNMSANGSFHHYQASETVAYYEAMSSPRDIQIASRRVGSAICAFGGSVKPEEASRKNSSIFRPKGASLDDSNFVRTPMSGHAYQESLQHRYFVSGDHLSWEIEANPPVSLPNENQTRRDLLVNMNTSSGSYAGKGGHDASPRVSHSTERSKRSTAITQSPSVVEMTSSGTEPPKMKYRCKLCGQPKQNHNCPYRQSMQRSIGITVRSAVNSYTAHEPGDLTPALSEINNFVSYDSDYGPSDTPKVASVAGKTTRHRRTHASVTPETALRSAGVLLSPGSSLSTRTPSPETTTMTPTYHQSHHHNVANQSDGRGAGSLKRTHSEMEEEPAYSAPTPFIEAVTLRPEQYRAVSHPKTPAAVGAYQYSDVALSFPTRRRLCDTLFFLSRQIPNLADECASILSDARRRGLWDLAVAELMAQVVVGLYCQEGDMRLDGLQQYLLYMNVSC